MTVHEKINIRAMIAQFATVGKTQFSDRFRKLRIGDSGELESTLRVIGKEEGSSLVVEIFYKYYGIFPHKGVGRGVTQEDTGIQRLVGGGRKRKPWQKGIGHTRYRLAELYQKKLGDGLETFTTDELYKEVYLKM